MIAAATASLAPAARTLQAQLDSPNDPGRLTLKQVERARSTGVGNDMRGIGEVAKASGLSISALRFYDAAGVLVPAAVDPATGYRRYSDEQIRAARLIAGLRRVGMPVADIAQVVRDLSDPAAARQRLELHRVRLEAGLADARRELLRIHALLDLQEDLMTRMTLPAATLAATIDAVRFAAGSDPSLPALAGVLIDADSAAVRLIATDRYRLAVAETPADVEGPPVRLVLPLSFVDDLRSHLTHPQVTGPLVLDVTADALRAEVAGRVIMGEPVGSEFPDYRRLIRSDDSGAGLRRVPVNAAALRDRLAAEPVVEREHDGSPYPVSVLAVDPAGGVRLVAEHEWAADAPAHVAVNREFLLQALDAGGAGQLVLELDGPIKPLAVRVVGDHTRFSILMPVRH
jgi:DNA-binding transcriptional MerR regulator